MVLPLLHSHISSFLQNHQNANKYHDISLITANSDGNRYDDYYEDEYQDQYDYDDDLSSPPPRTKRYIPNQITNLLELLRNHKQLGASLVGLGLMMTFIGMMLFFNGFLLRFGNICIIFGVPLLVGPDTVKQFFLQRSRMQASIIVAIGVFLVMWGKPRLGILCEIFGLLNTMGNMNPFVLAMIKRLPLIGDMMKAFEGQPKETKEPSNSRRGKSYRPPKRANQYSQF